jgi:hypothetical protein
MPDPLGTRLARLSFELVKFQCEGGSTCQDAGSWLKSVGDSSSRAAAPPRLAPSLPL